MSSYGYDGSVNEGPWSKLSQFLGSMYSIAGANDLLVIPKSGATRTVTVKACPNGAYGRGVLDITTSDVDIAIPEVDSGSTRYDMIVWRRNWETNTSAPARIAGSSQASTLPVRTTDPGVTVDDQPIALVKATAGSTAVVVNNDLRVWGAGGVFTARDELVLQYLTQPGVRVRIGEREWIYRIRDDGSAFDWYWTSARKIYDGTTPPPYEAGALFIDRS